MKKTFIALLTAFVGLIALAQNPGRVTLELSTDSVWIGDQATLAVNIEKDVSHEVAMPEFKEGKIGDMIEILGSPVLDTIARDGRSMTVRLRYTITSFDAGAHSLAGFPVLIGLPDKMDTVVASNEVILNVKTFEIDTTKQQIFDIKQPLDAPVTWAEAQPYVWWGLFVVVVLVAIIWGVVWWTRRRGKAVYAKAKAPSHVVAMGRLENLHNKKLWQAGKAKEYFSELTDIVRQYIEERYGVEALEMTSAEILGALGEFNTPKLDQTLRSMLSVADFVKFAKLTPNADECETAYFDACQYVEQTKIDIQEQTETETVVEPSKNE